MAFFLGIDVGSSSCKVAVFNLDGKLAAYSSHSNPTHEPQPGFREQDPEHWWQAVVQGIR